MQIGRVVGQAVSTVKHPSMTGWRLLLVQLLTADGKEDGEPLLAIDNLGARSARRVVICPTTAARSGKLVGRKNSPVRWMVMGIV